MEYAKRMERMESARHFDNVASSIADNSIVRAIRKGLIYMMPLILVGSFVLMLLNLPIPAFQNAMLALFGESWRTAALAVYSGTFEVMALAELLAVSYALAGEKQPVKSGQVGALSVILTVFACYVAFHANLDGFRLEGIGSTGMFGALVTAVVGTSLFLFLFEHPLRRIRPFTNDADAVLMNSLRTLAPALMTILLFSIARVLLEVTGFPELTARLYTRFCGTLLQDGQGLGAALWFSLLTHVLWFFGMHGTNMLDSVAGDLFTTASETNIALAGAGGIPTEILTKEYFDTFVYMGGCGSTLGLLLALLLFSRSGSTGKVARASLLPGIFNINEMMVYGLPLVFNPYYLIPFLLTPMVLGTATYLAMYAGWVPLTISRVTWTTPIFISGYVSTGSVAGIALQAVNLALAVLIYLPFVILYEKHQDVSRHKVFQSLRGELAALQASAAKGLLVQGDEAGALARMLAQEIEDSIRNKASCLTLEYQPKVDGDGRVNGAEALLRWRHPVYGYVPPDVILGIADEAELTNRLGAWVAGEAVRQLGLWHGMGWTGLRMAVNLSPLQIRGDESLSERIGACVDEAGIPPGCLEMELTESAAIDNSSAVRQRLGEIKALGVNISIDDFGMGHSSLLYLRDFYANIVKIDKSLVDNIGDDRNSQEIVRSITSLCAQLGVEVVAEGVEQREQAEILAELGCRCYQGWLFSKSLPPDEFERYIKEKGYAPLRQEETV